MVVAICEKCGEAVSEADAVRLVTVARADGRDSRRVVACRECAERLLRSIQARHFEVAVPEVAGWR